MFDEYQKQIYDFTRPDCDRKEFITAFCRENSIKYHLLKMDDLVHILIPGDSVDKEKRLKTFTAHYDRYPESPGANDNSASIIQLLFFYKNICQSKNKPDSCQILFTDGEEIREKSEISRQGSYLFGEILNDNQIKNWLFLVFDLCGIGNWYIYDYSLTAHEEKIANGIESALRMSAGSRLIRDSRFASDDLGFRLMNQAVARFSLLPECDIDEYKKTGIPPCWKRNHSIKDSFEYLEERSYTLQMRFLHNLAYRNF